MLLARVLPHGRHGLVQCFRDLQRVLALLVHFYYELIVLGDELLHGLNVIEAEVRD